MATRAELIAERAKIDEQIAKLNEKEAGKGFEDIIERARNYSAHFTAEQKAEIASLMGFEPASTKAKKSTKKAGTRTQVGPKKYILPTGEAWGGQGKTPKHFADWQEKNSGKDFPLNPEWKDPKAK